MVKQEKMSLGGSQLPVTLCLRKSGEVLDNEINFLDVAMNVSCCILYGRKRMSKLSTTV